MWTMSSGFETEYNVNDMINGYRILYLKIFITTKDALKDDKTFSADIIV